MATDPSLRDAEIERLVLLIQIASKRLGRAREKLDQAKLEFADAKKGFSDALDDKEDWLRANPPAQPNLL